MKYLVSGATGFIGTELCRQLPQAGDTLLALSRSGFALPCGTTTTAMDFGNQMPDSALLCGVDVAFHLAGIAHQRAQKDLYWQINHQATLRLARACAAAGVRCFVFLSSVKSMGPAVGNKVRRESDCLPPLDAYGHSKLYAEQDLCREFEHSPMSVVILRPALVYGGQAKGNLHSLARAVRAGLPRPPARGARSMISRDDLVRLLCILGVQPPEGVNTWIVTDGQAYSTRRLADGMRGALGRTPGKSWCPYPLWHLGAKLMDIRRATGEESSLARLFGNELYSNTALLEATTWRPQQEFEDVAYALMASTGGAA